MSNPPHVKTLSPRTRVGLGNAVDLSSLATTDLIPHHMPFLRVMRLDTVPGTVPVESIMQQS